MKTLMIVISFVLAGMGTVAAEQKTLTFRLMTHMTSGTFIEASSIAGRRVGAAKYAGVAIFDDGRLADKEYVLNMDNRGAEGSYSGYSTYTFENGDSLSLSFTGGWGSGRSGGDYTVLSGTGDYEGATGSGRFDAVKEPWANASLFNVTINVRTKD